MEAHVHDGRGMRRGLNFLAPCPWCGAKGVLQATKDAAPRYFVMCTAGACPVTARTLAYADPGKAARVWNKRRWPKQ